MSGKRITGNKFFFPYGNNSGGSPFPPAPDGIYLVSSSEGVVTLTPYSATLQNLDQTLTQGNSSNKDIVLTDNTDTNTITKNSVAIQASNGQAYLNPLFVQVVNGNFEFLANENGIYYYKSSSDSAGLIKFDLLTQSQEYQHPNKSGTYALLDDLVKQSIININTDYTGSVNDKTVLVDTSEGNVKYNLPPIGDAYDVINERGCTITIKKISGSGSAIVKCSDAGVITKTLSLDYLDTSIQLFNVWESVTLQLRANIWYIIAYDEGKFTTQQHTTGDTVTIDKGIKMLIVNPANDLNPLTITLPEIRPYGNKVKVAFGGDIPEGGVVADNLIFVGFAGEQVLGSGSIISANSGDSYEFVFDDVLGIWRIF